MVTVITKRDGPRREDVVAKRLIAENRPTIERLADRLTGGGDWRERLKPPSPPSEEACAASFVSMSSAPARRTEPRPYVRISANGRVVVVDAETSRQTAFLGEIRGGRGDRRFVLATADNGFFAPVEDALREALCACDGTPVPDEDAEDRLAADVARLLGFAAEG